MALIGVLSTIFSYLKEKANPQAAATLGKKLAFLSLIVATLSVVSPIIDKFQPDHPQHVPREYFEENFSKLQEAMAKNPPEKEVESELDQEFRKAYQKEKKEALKLYNAGDTAYVQGRFKEALSYFLKAKRVIEVPAFLFSQGNALKRLGRNDEALTAYDKALEIKPDHADAWYNKGVTLGDLGRNDEAIAAYDKALEIKPDHAAAWYNKGGALGLLGRDDEAIAAFDKALEIKPDYGAAWYNKGVTLRQLGRNDEAIAAYDKALAIFKKNKSPYTERARGRIAQLRGEIK